MEKGKKRLATLVGINYIRSPKFKLHGCINDVLAMKGLLQSTFKFKENNIKLLTDDRCNLGTDCWPSGKNIKLAINKMIDEAEEGDVLCFYFSGHGTLLPNPDNVDQPEDAIVPCDFNLITDVDFRNFVDRVPKKASFTIFADACHSGGLVYEEKEQIGPVAIPKTEKITETSPPVRGIPIEFIVQQLIEQLKSKHGNVLNIESLDVGSLLSQTFGYASSLKILVRNYLVSLSTNPSLSKLLEAGSQFYVKNKATFEKAAANLAATKEAAKDAAKQAADAAKDAAENAAAVAKDAAAAAKYAAKEAAADAATATKDAAKDAAVAAAAAAKDTARDAAVTAKDAARDATDVAKDAAKDAATTAKDAGVAAVGAAGAAVASASTAGMDRLLGATGAAAVVNKLWASGAYVLGAFFFFLVRVMQAFATRIQALGIWSRLFPAANNLVAAGNARVATAANDFVAAGNDLVTVGNARVAAAANDLVTTAGSKLLAAGNNILAVGNDFVSTGNDLFAAAGNDLFAACNDIVAAAAGDDLLGIGSDFIKVLCAESVAIGSDLFKALNDASRKFNLKDRKYSENADAGILLSGCQRDETSKDAKATGDGEEAGGAFSKALRVVLEEHKLAPFSYRKVVIKIRKIIRDRGYTQHPCLYSADENADKPFLWFKR